MYPIPFSDFYPFKDIEDEWWDIDTKTPRTDVYEEKGRVVAEMELPGVEPKDIVVEIQDNALRVEAKTSEKREEEEKGYYTKEIKQGYYKRVLPLPVEVKEDKVDASYDNGVLTVTAPKKREVEEPKGKRVEVKSKEKKSKPKKK